MTACARLLLVSGMAILPTVVMAGGRYSSWFDGDPLSVGTSTASTRFGVDLYRYAEDPRQLDIDPDHAVSIFGDYGGETSGAPRFVNFGVRWRHRMSAQDHLSVSAAQGQRNLPHVSAIAGGVDSLDTRAAVSWTRDLSSWGARPSVTGGLFLGEQAAREAAQPITGRRYLGMAIGGEMRIMQEHTPYLSFSMERSLYDMSDATGGSIAQPTYLTDDTSRLSAGWRWQMRSGWSLQAEASYGFDLNRHNDLSGLDSERGRVFFGTRYDFK